MECISDQFEIEPTNLIEKSESKLPNFVQSLVESNDKLSAESMHKEIARLRRILKATKVRKEESLGWTSLRFLESVIEYELSIRFLISL